MGSIGLAEMMIYRRLKYGSAEAVEFIDKLYQFIAVTAYEASVELAREKGAFEKFDAEKFLQSGFMKSMPSYIRDLVGKYGIRNVTIMTQAPTGTVGTMVGTSTGIEPFFPGRILENPGLGFMKKKLNWLRIGKPSIRAKSCRTILPLPCLWLRKSMSRYRPRCSAGLIPLFPKLATRPKIILLNRPRSFIL